MRIDTGIEAVYLSGTRVNHWVILNYLPIRGRHRKVVAKCDCGNTKIVDLENIKKGHSKSCGCKRNEYRALVDISKFIGIKYNKWTILEDAGLRGRIRMVKAICECGAKMVVSLSKVKTGKSKCCGCIKKDISHLIGRKYNRITVKKDLGVVGRVRMIIGVCDCGVEKSFNWLNVKLNKSKSCGCLPIEKNTKHGLSGHPLYTTWEGMIDRCYNKRHLKYYRYGGRGVIMCKEWRTNFKCFYDWAISHGWEPGLSLDKDKLSPTRLGVIYCPEFCCFMTRKENTMYRSNSRIVEYNGEKLCVSQMAEKYGINQHTFRGRLNNGWTIDEIVTIPLFKYAKKIAS